MAWSLERLSLLVHPSVSGDELLTARHCIFIAAHLAAGVLALCAVPLTLALVGRPGTMEGVALAWVMVPILAAAFLSRTGHLEAAHLLSALGLAGLSVHLAILTGGSSSPAMLWLVIVPLECAASGSRRVIGIGLGIAVAALILVLVLSTAVPDRAPSAFDASGAAVLAGALLYAGILALAVDRLAGLQVEHSRRQESRFRILAGGAGDLVTCHNPSGTISFASPASHSLLGVDPKDLLGNGLLDRVHVADRPAYLQALGRTASTGKPASLEFRARREATEEGQPSFVWLEMRCRPVADGRDGRSGVISATRDVDDRKRQETEMRAALDEAERASTAKTSFLAHVSHELRTPLNAIIGFSEIMRDEAGMGIPTERRREYARNIHESGTHLLRLVNDILDVSRIESGSFQLSPEPLDLRQLVESCTRLVACQAREAGLEIVTEFGEVPQLVADERACRQILLNLLSNALKFTKAGGKVVVSVGRDGDRALFRVSDTGIGIAAGDIHRLGRPFVQADGSYGRHFSGAGLGLSIVKGLVSLHGGSLSIESEHGRGTCITVRLPLASGACTDMVNSEPVRWLKRA